MANRKAKSILKSESDTALFDKVPDILKKDIDKNLCVCNDIPKKEIINAILNGATTVEEVRKQTFATMGIGCCAQQVERLIDDLFDL